jgi:hypothetical protein
VAAVEAETAMRQANAALGGLFRDPALTPPGDR